MRSMVYNVDCMVGMKEYSDKYFDLAVVDPPYGILESGGQTGGENNFLGKRAFTRSKIEKWDHKPTKEYFDELFRVSKNQIIWGGNYFDLPPTRCVLVWDKVQPWENFSQVEIAWTSFGLPAQLFTFDNRTGGKIHPTQKPIELYRWIYRKYAKEGYKILDTHLGSGSSRIAAYEDNLDFVGFEIDKEYFDKQEKRFEEFTSQTSLFY